MGSELGECDRALYDARAAPEANRARIMRMRERPILVENYKGRFPTGLSASDRAERSEVALALRASGWVPYRVRFDNEAAVWIANVIDWGLAA